MTSVPEGIFSRTELLLGSEKMDRLASAKVILFGVGGVGSWCAEGLIRSGIGHLTIVDSDRVDITNINRQLMATTRTVGRLKVEVLRERLLEINPACRVEARFERFTGFDGFDGFDVVVDAIDSVDCKAELIIGATERGIPLVSSMGAALRTDPSKVVVMRFDKVEGDGLARALRQRFKKIGRYPAAKFRCVCSTEQPMPLAPSAEKGSLMQVTATFGMCLAAETVNAICLPTSRTHL